jgi:hypothetical protein
MANSLQDASIRFPGASSTSLTLELVVEDRDTVAELSHYAPGEARQQYALEALKIGVLALRRASTTIDTEAIGRETTRLLEVLGRQLDDHARNSQQRMATSLQEYFDPESGRFSQRVKRLTSDDGELSQLLRGLLDGDDSRLAKTLLDHVGTNSPLMKVLSPDQSQGLLATLKSVVESQLGQQRERILKEFSLDNGDGALARLVRELSQKHGDLSKDLQQRIDQVVKEFSLDQEDSALSRLVRNVDRAQRTITSEFSLDNEQSALRRLKSELASVLEQQGKQNAQFQEEVKVALGQLATRREEQQRSTLHGADFQDSLFAFLAHDCQARGDLIDDTGDIPGLIARCKVGDAVLELGAEHAAAGARIVIEAKQDASYSLARARSEIEQARKNRNAQIGIFVFSQRTVSAGVEPLVRVGPDLFVVWDDRQPESDTYLRAALEIARALCVRDRRSAQRRDFNFQPLEKSLLDIEKRAANLEEIRRCASNIQTNTDKICERVRIDREALEKQVGVLRSALTEVKQRLDQEAP